jgi:glycosyltransferase involved in cell wall biosynthesis
MRILQVSDCYPPAIGGTERHVQSLSRELVRRGHKVAVATLSEVPGGSGDGVELHRLLGWSRILAPFREEPTRPLHPPVPDPGIVNELRGLLDRWRPDVVHAHGWSVYSCLAVRALRPVPLVVTLHDYGLFCANKCLLTHGERCTGPGHRKCLECAGANYGTAKGVALAGGLIASRRLHRRADLYIAISRAVADHSAPSAGGVEIEVIPSFVPDDVVVDPSLRARPAFAPEGEYVMFAGRFGPEKGIDVLLRAQAQMPDTQMLIVGAGSANLQGCLPQQITVVQNLANDDVMAAWAHATVAVVPSVWDEPFGQVAIEAMAAGRPVVASRVGGLAELVDEQTGISVAPGDAEELAEAIGRLLADADLRAKLGAQGRRRAREFTVSAVAGRIEAVFERLCQPTAIRSERVT